MLLDNMLNTSKWIDNTLNTSKLPDNMLITPFNTSKWLDNTLNTSKWLDNTLNNSKWLDNTLNTSKWIDNMLNTSISRSNTGHHIASNSLIHCCCWWSILQPFFVQKNCRIGYFSLRERPYYGSSWAEGEIIGRWYVQLEWMKMYTCI